jgi:hypothetical protein
VERVPEVVPGYPDRIVAKPGHEAELKKRTLTNLYNARPAWLDNAHQALDAAVAAAYGWPDYTPAMPDEEILRRLLALNLVQTPYSVDITGCDTQPHGLKFAAFVYDDQAYPARWADPFMESEYNRQSALITSIGELLNDLVRSQGNLYDTNNSHRNQI